MQPLGLSHLAILLKIIAVQPDLSMGDRFLSHLLSHHDIWGALPKVWLRYVDAFLYHAVADREGYLKGGVVIRYLDHHVLSSAFILKAKLSKHLQGKYLTTPSGRFKLSVQYQNPPKLCYFKSFTEGSFLESRAWLWVITLNPDISLNTSIEQLHIPQRYEESCSEASLNFHTEISAIGSFGTPSVPRFHWECAADKDMTLPEIPIMKYCGWRSDFNVYFAERYRDMNIAVCYQEFSYILVNMLYQVTDVDGVKNIPVDHQRKLANAILVSIISVEEKQLTSMHLMAPKYAQFFIILNLEPNAYIVFDGPSQHSRKLQVENNLMKTTSFQCLLLFVEFPNMTQINSYFHFHPVVTNLINEALVISQRANFPVFTNFPSKECSSSFCFVDINVETDHKINVTILQIAFQGQNSFSCNLAGLSSFALELSKYQEARTVCSFPGEKGTVKSQSFYSRSNKLLLVVYWYPEINSQKILFAVRKTKCHLLQIDPCAVKSLCQDWKPRAPCITYLANTSTHSNIKLQATEHMSWVFDGNLLPNVRFKAIQAGCAVVQLTQSKKLFPEMRESGCGLHFIGNHQSFSPFQVYLKAYIGSIAPSCFKFLTQENISSHSLSKETKDFTGIATDLRNRHFMMSMKILSSEKKHFLDHLEVIFWGASGSWLEILLNITEKPTPRKTNCQFVDLQKAYEILDLALQNANHRFSLMIGQSLPQEYALEISFNLLLDTKRFPRYIVADTLDSLQFKSPGYILTADHILFCTVREPFLSSQEHFPYSFPGRFSTLEVESKTEMNLSICWHYDYYEKHIRKMKMLHKCDKVASLEISNSFSVNCSINPRPNNVFKNYIIFGTRHKVAIVPINQSLIPWASGILQQEPKFSWIRASSKCSEIGGFLPIFYQREDLDQLLAFIKLSQECPFMQAMFVGISLAEPKKVEHICCKVLFVYHVLSFSKDLFSLSRC